MPTIILKTDTGQTDRDGDPIFAYSKNVVAFSYTDAALAQRRARIVNRQTVVTALLALIDDGEDVSDLTGTRDPSRETWQRESDALAAALGEVDEALAL